MSTSRDRLRSLSDMDLLREYAHNNSQRAFEVIYQRYRKMISKICAQELGDKELAEESMQEVFLQLAREAKSLVAQD